MSRRDGRGPPIELDTEALDRLASALDVEPVVSADLIGSHASGRPSPLSDVDVAVWLDSELDPAERFTARLRYRGVFQVLERADLIEGDLADRLGEAAGLRNLLVHGYADIDDAQIWARLARLDDLRAFALAVNRALER